MSSSVQGLKDVREQLIELCNADPEIKDNYALQYFKYCSRFSDDDIFKIKLGLLIYEHKEAIKRLHSPDTVLRSFRKLNEDESCLPSPEVRERRRRRYEKVRSDGGLAK